MRGRTQRLSAAQGAAFTRMTKEAPGKGGSASRPTRWRQRRRLAMSRVPQNDPRRPVSERASCHHHIGPAPGRSDKLDRFAPQNGLLFLRLLTVLCDRAQLTDILGCEGGRECAAERLLLSVRRKHPGPGKRLQQVPLHSAGETPGGENHQDLEAFGHGVPELKGSLRRAQAADCSGERGRRDHRAVSASGR